MKKRRFTNMRFKVGVAMWTIIVIAGACSFAALPGVVTKMLSKSIAEVTTLQTPQATLSTKRPVVVDAIIDHIMSTNRKIYLDMAVKQARMFKSAGKEFRLPTTTLAAIACTESHYDSFAVSKQDCVGIMQVRPKVWLNKLIDAGIVTCQRDLYNHALNIRAGAWIFRQYMDKHRGKGQFRKALAAYNGTTPDKVGRYAAKFHQHLGALTQLVSENLAALEHGERGGDVG